MIRCRFSKQISHDRDESHTLNNMSIARARRVNITTLQHAESLQSSIFMPMILFHCYA
jgi:hypothetical protein